MSKYAIIGARGYPSTYGGFETLVRRLAPFLADHGHSVFVYGRDQGIRTRSHRHRGVEVRLTPGVDTKSLSALSFGVTAARDAARIGVDAAVVLNVANGYFLRHLAKAGVATCVNVDGAEWERGKWGPLAKRVFIEGARRSALHADELIFDSQALRTLWSAKFGRSGRFIAYGADLVDNAGSQRLAARGLPSKGYVLSVCRVVPENHVDLLLDAVDLLPEEIPVVVAGASVYSHPTTARLESLSASGRVKWLGHVHDQELLAELWANAGVYFHGHSVGGTNPALLQALGCGAPTVALDTPYNAEVLGDSAHLVGRDAPALAAKLSAVIGSPELATAMGRHGQRVVKDRYSWESVCQSYLDVLTEIETRKTEVREPFGAARACRSSAFE